MTNEWGAPLTGEEMLALKGRIDPKDQAERWGHAHDYDWWFFDADEYRLPGNHPHYKAREYNQKLGTNLVLHDGSAKVPDDFAPGIIMFRDGDVCRLEGNDGAEAMLWRHSNGLSDIIAYTPKPKEVEVTEEFEAQVAQDKAAFEAKPEAVKNMLRAEADAINPSNVEPFDNISPERKAELREQGPLPGSGLSPCEQMPSDEAIEYVLRFIGSAASLDAVKEDGGAINTAYLDHARLIQQYEPDRLKPAVEVAAEAYAAEEREVGSVRYTCSLEGFKAGAAWRLNNPTA